MFEKSTVMPSAAALLRKDKACPGLLIALLLLAGFCRTAFAQDASASFFCSIERYGEEDGLSDKQVNCIAKDGRGALWVGTDYGLNRFDGKHFKTYTSRHGLRSNQIHDIVVDGHRLWLITEAQASGVHFSQIDVFDSYKGRAVPFERYYRSQIPFGWPQVKHIRVADSTLFFCLYNGKRFAFDARDGWHALGRLPSTEAMMGKDQLGHYWSNRRQKDSVYLVKRDQLGNKLGQVAFTADALMKVRWLHKHRSGKASFLLSYSGKGGAVTLLDIYPDMQYRIVALGPEPGVDVAGLFYRLDFIPALDALWVAVGGKALLLSADGKLLLRDESVPEILSSKWRFNLVEDNTVWHCGNDGFYRITVGANTFHNVCSGSEASTISFRGMVQVDNALYMGCEKGLFPFRQASSALPRPLLGQAVLAAEMSRDSKLLMTSYNSLLTYDLNLQARQVFSLPYHEPWSVYKDPYGYIWLSQSGVCRLDPNTGKVDYLDYSAFPELQNNTVYHFYELDTNRVLLCSTSGLYELDPTRGLTARYWEGGRGDCYLPASDFRHLYHDKKRGVFWLATGQTGLLRWQPSSARHQLFPFREGITNVVHSVYADDYGFLWMSTQHGIVQFDRSSHDFIIYTTQDGLRENEFNRISHLQSPDGTLYFGHIRGMAYFHPQDFRHALSQELRVSPTVVELQQYLGSGRRLANRTAFYQEQQRIVMQPNDRYFTLTLGLDDVRWAEDAVFYYRLSPGEEEVPLEGNQVTLGRLPYGRQELQVRVLLANGRFSANTLSIPIWVRRPFYLRWWFALILAAAVALLVYWRTWQLDRRNKELEAEVHRRTAKIQKDQELIAQQANELKQLDGLKSRFFANLSHELRTPLTLIMGPLNQLLKQTSGSPHQRLVQIAHDQSRKLLRLVNDIMDLSKLEATSLEVDKQPAKLLPFIKQTLSAFELYARREGIRLELSYQASPDLVVHMDAKKVETILHNYLANATKYTATGGLVQLQASLQDNKLRFEVKDTGRGIPAAELPKVFDRYFQSAVNTKAEGGTGLGLALSKELANLLNGKVWAESREGQGSSFFLELYDISVSSASGHYEAVSLQPSSASTAPAAPRQEAKPAKGATVLIVEDHHGMQDYLLSLLQPHYNTMAASNGQAALDLLEQQEQLPDLILTDLMMPVMSGYSLMKQLKQRARYRSIPLVVLTAKAGLEDRLAALRVGVDDHLAKPFVAEELLVRIRNLLANAASRKQAALYALQPAAAPAVAAVGDANASEQQTWLAQLETVLSEHLNDQRFSVGFLAEKLDLSRHTLNRRLKAKVGLTTTQYLQEFRLHHARQLLESGKVLTVSAAAQACGIMDVKYFSQLFKKRFGQPPSYYL